MEGSSKKFSLINSHFFLPLLPGFDSNFAIPKSFNKYLGEYIEEADGKFAILRNYKVEDNLWMVKVCYFDNKLNFKNGWEKFCKDHGLQIGDFLVFKHHQNLVFDVFVFDSSYSERPYPGVTNATTENVRSPSSNIQSKKALARLRKPIPMEFARKHDLANKWCDITVIDQKGKEWLLPLRYHKRGFCVHIGRPHEFLVANDLKPGDPIVFELIVSGDFPKMNFYRKTLNS